MQPTISLSSSEWVAQIHRLIAQTRRSAVDIVTEEARLALELAVKLTPPNDYAQGRSAVARDIKRTMRPLNADEMTKSKRVERVVREGRVAEFNSMSPFFRGTLKGVRVVPFSQSEHLRWRDRRGRVVSDKRQAVIGRDSRELSKYVTRMQAFVGWAKAGWANALKAAGGSVPSWVERHREAAGGVVNELQSPEGPQLTVVNKTEWGAREGPRVAENVSRIRSSTMKKKIERMIREEVLKSGGEVR